MSQVYNGVFGQLKAARGKLARAVCLFDPQDYLDDESLVALQNKIARLEAIAEDAPDAWLDAEK